MVAGPIAGRSKSALTHPRISIELLCDALEPRKVRSAPESMRSSGARRTSSAARTFARTAPVACAEPLVRAELTASGLPRILAHLEEWGVIDYVGAGRGRRVQLRPDHCIARALRDPPPRSTWIAGPVTERRDRLHEPVVVGVRTEADFVDAAWHGLRAPLTETQAVLAAIIELSVTTQADLMASERSDLSQLETVFSLIGPRPLDLLGIGVSFAATPAPGGDHRTSDLPYESVLEVIDVFAGAVIARAVLPDYLFDLLPDGRAVAYATADDGTRRIEVITIVVDRR